VQPDPVSLRLTGMKNSVAAAAGVLVTVTLAAGCASSTNARPAAGGGIISRGVAVREPAASPRPYGAADTAFGLGVLSAWCQAEPRQNFVFSPASLAAGLGMAYLGARGGTAAAMARVLHLPAAGGQELAGLQARSAAMRGLDSPGVTVAESDQVWADPHLVTRRSYLNAVATGYDAGVARVPLLSKPDQVVGEIDHAVATATRGQIPRLLKPGSLQGIGWVLTDALYLHAAWQAPFDPSQTRPEPFTTGAGQVVTVKFLQGGSFRFVRAGGWTAVRLPYRGGRLAMLALLPSSGTSGCPVLSPQALSSMTARLAAGGAAASAISMPKVSLSSQADMRGLLGQLGMSVAFSGAADFTGLSPQAADIGLVQHSATLAVAEKGTVASAATAVGIEPTAGRVELPEIRFDRPYLLVVTDTATGEPLFLARVASPL
jgi:serine protease inhibitor